ncbi:calcium-binding protein [Planktotalea sp.]|uniref:calcium-binding protein n=1 Tax=Planktotalea sp. TaxID=2029877 RepID=UPI003D6B9239
MTTTIISSAMTTTQTMDGNDIILLTPTGSVVMLGLEAFLSTGANDRLVVSGYVASDYAAIYSAEKGFQFHLTSTGVVQNISNDNFAAYFFGGDANILVDGAISGAVGMTISGINSELVNTGAINGLGNSLDDTGTGTALQANGENLLVNNSGQMIGTRTGVDDNYGAANNLYLINSGEISGSEAGVRLLSGSDQFIENTGVISASNGFSLDIAAGGVEVRNYGLLDGDVQMIGEDSELANLGTILGDVTFGDGTDTFQGKLNGFVDGAVYGNLGDDTLRGSARDDEFYGGADNDSLKGNDGDDLLYAGGGDDTIRGNLGDDQIEGNQGQDWILGGRGDDNIKAGSGMDTINGGKGDDVMTGGTGADVFVFARKSGDDEITDFNNNTDKLDLSAYGISSRQDLTDANAILADGAGSIIDLRQIGGDGVIYVEDMGVGQWSNPDFIF